MDGMTFSSRPSPGAMAGAGEEFKAGGQGTWGLLLPPPLSG